MATLAASQLKAGWMELPDECFETLTFGELKVGDKFIALPNPGDNHGHGGFQGSAYIYVKTDKDITHATPELRYGIPHGRAVKIGLGVSSDLPHSMPVIKVE